MSLSIGLSGCIGQSRPFSRDMWLYSLVISEEPADAPITDSSDLPLDDMPFLIRFLNETVDTESDLTLRVTIGDCDEVYNRYDFDGTEREANAIIDVLDTIPGYAPTATCYPVGSYIRHRGTIVAVYYDQDE